MIPKVGFSFSPGGLLLPYHLGVKDNLYRNGYLDETTPIAGSSAGAISVACHGCGIDSELAFELTVKVSDTCHKLGGATGRLLPLLREHLSEQIGEKQLATIRERKAPVAIAYQEVFPQYRPILQTTFNDEKDIVNAVCNSSMFPFFSSRWPCAWDWSEQRTFPRLVVDGFFTVPRSRFGCPDFSMAGIDVERTVLVSCFPQDAIGLDATSPEDCISPLAEEGDEMLKYLFELAMNPSSRKDLKAVYDLGWSDAERWCKAQTLADPSTIEHETLTPN